MRAGLICLPLLFIAATCFADGQGKQYKLKVKGERVVLLDRTPGHQHVRKELERTFEERARAVKTLDAAAQIAQVSPSYLGKNIDGSPLDYPSLIQYMRAGTAQWVEAKSVSFKIEGFALKGNEATIDARQNHVRTQRLSDGLVHLVETGVLQREVWIRGIDGWQLKSTDHFRERFVKVDGRLVEGG